MQSKFGFGSILNLVTKTNQILTSNLLGNPILDKSEPINATKTWFRFNFMFDYLVTKNNRHLNPNLLGNQILDESKPINATKTISMQPKFGFGSILNFITKNNRILTS